jgi:hypothetical protein
MVTEYTNQQQERIEWLQKNLDEQNDIDQVYFLKIILDFTKYIDVFNFIQPWHIMKNTRAS